MTAAVTPHSGAAEVLMDDDIEAGPAIADAAKPRAPAVDPEMLPLVLVLVGRMGVGKSSTANSLLSLPEGCRFEARHSAAAVTGACRGEVGFAFGREVLVLDTPGFGDPTKPIEEVFKEIRRGITEMTPAGALLCPLIVLGLQGRVGEEDFEMIEGLRHQVFGQAMLTTALVVWTHADALDECSGLEGYLQGCGERLRELLAEFAGGSAVLDNRSVLAAESSPSPQVEALLRQAAAVAAPCTLCKVREPRPYGRKSARRLRQIEAGLLKAPGPPQDAPGCIIT